MAKNTKNSPPIIDFANLPHSSLLFVAGPVGAGKSDAAARYFAANFPSQVPLISAETGLPGGIEKTETILTTQAEKDFPSSEPE